MVNLTPEIVSAMIQIIDMCAKQGAFTGGNITVAGQVRSELTAALEAASTEDYTQQTEVSEK